MAMDKSLHHNIMLQILKDIYADTSVSPFLGFKGGTAAYIFYGLDRFSVDLDFDLLNENKEDLVFERIEQIIKNYGRLKEAWKKRFNLFFVLSYEETAQNIKIEINRRSFSSRYEVKTYLGISMLVMVRDDMFAHKLVAMHERSGKTNRDIYDTWFFLKNNWPINKEIVAQRAGLSFASFLQKCIVLLEEKTDRNILAGIGELLDSKQKTWVKAELRTDTIFLLKLMLDNEQKL